MFIEFLRSSINVEVKLACKRRGVLLRLRSLDGLFLCLNTVEFVEGWELAECFRASQYFRINYSTFLTTFCWRDFTFSSWHLRSLVFLQYFLLHSSCNLCIFFFENPCCPVSVLKTRFTILHPESVDTWWAYFVNWSQFCVRCVVIHLLGNYLWF